MESESVCNDEEDEGKDDKRLYNKQTCLNILKVCFLFVKTYRLYSFTIKMFRLRYTFCLHFFLINIHIFDYPDSRLSGLFIEVPTSLDNRGSTVIVLCNKAVPRDTDCDMRVFQHTFFLECATERRGNL